MNKSWYASKSVWGGILVIIGTVGKVLIAGEISPEDIASFGIGLGVLGLRFSAPTKA